MTVISVMQKVPQLRLMKMRQYTTTSFMHKKLSTNLEHAGEHLSETLLNAMKRSGSPERYNYFVLQESFNHAGSFVLLRLRLMSYEKISKYT